jgi:hypothetical protein
MIPTKSANLISFPLAAALVDGAEVLVVLWVTGITETFEERYGFDIQGICGFGED